MARTSLYKWDEWFRRRRVTLRRGKDFTCGIGTMIQQLRNAASKRGYAIHVEELENLPGALLVQVTGKCAPKVKGGRR